MKSDPHSGSTFDRLAELLNRIAAPGGRPITRTTELYYDLGLAGDDLYEIIVEVYTEFGTDFSTMTLAYYAPGETEALFSFDMLREVLGRPRRYRSLTVQHLERVIETGIWENG